MKHSRNLVFVFLFCLLIQSCGGSGKENGSDSSKSTKKDGSPAWVNDPMKIIGDKVFIVGMKTNANTIEEGIESSRSFASAELSHSIASNISSVVTDKMKAVMKDNQISDEQFVQSVVESTSKSQLIGLQQVDKHVIEYEENGTKKYDVYTKWTIAKPYYDEQINKVREQLKRAWYNDPQRAIETARVYLRDGSYNELITELEPLISLLPAEAYLLIAQAHEKLGAIDKARNIYQSIVQQFPRSKESQNAQIRMTLLLESSALSRIQTAKQLVVDGKYQGAIEEIGQAIHYITKKADRNDAIKVYYEAASKETVRLISPSLSKLPKRRLAILSFATADNRITKETELLKQSLLSELTNVPDIKIFTPEVTAVTIGKIFQRDKDTLQQLSTQLDSDGFLYAVAGQLTFVYLIDKEGALLGSSNITSLSYDFLEEEVTEASRELVLQTAFLSKTQGKWKKINEGAVLYSGDEFRTVFKTSKDAFVYVILIDSQWNINMLLPSEGIEIPNSVNANTTYLLPPPGNLFFLDDNKGVEQFLLIASVDEISGLTGKIRTINSEGDQSKRSDLVKQFIDEITSKAGSSSVKETKETISIAIPGTGDVTVNLEKVTGKSRVVRLFTIVHK
ncbi:MAG: DUF4384 domain-containing protein [Planctomycetes bacterium]|nr:DUF4384 domain-containing protein [Planctomycetota bacterium]